MFVNIFEDGVSSVFVATFLIQKMVCQLGMILDFMFISFRLLHITLICHHIVNVYLKISIFYQGNLK